MAYHVLIADEQRVSRLLFERIVSSDARYRVIASIDAAILADAWCARGGVDLILMDVVRKDGSSSLNAAARLRQSYPDVKIIVVTSTLDPLLPKMALAAGVESFWYKEVEAEPILQVMDRTMAGERVWPAGSPAVRLGNIDSDNFTRRELDVLRLLAEGLIDREIAERLALGLPTVRSHVRHLMDKSGLSSRTKLAVSAVRSGLIVPGLLSCSPAQTAPAFRSGSAVACREK